MDESFSSLKVLIDMQKEDSTDENEFSGNSFATACLLLVINMFARDIQLPVEYSSIVRGVNHSASAENDIFVNYKDQDKVYDKNRVESIWPHYQNRYCFIYANAKVLPSLDFSFSEFSTSHLLIAVFCLMWIYHFYILYARLNAKKLESLIRGLIYSIQIQISSSVPSLDKYPHERFFVAAMLIFCFISTSVYMSYFITTLTVPTIRPARDDEVSRELSLEPIKDFGIGEPCLYELVQGIYMRRGCLLACDAANATVRRNPGIVFLRGEMDFQDILKARTDSKHFKTITILIRRYFEAGMIDKMFIDIQKESHKFLAVQHFNENISLNELRSVILFVLTFGYSTAFLAFIGEHIHFALSKRRSTNLNRKKHIKLYRKRVLC